MPKPKTHFEQIPLKVVLKIVKEEVEGESDKEGEIDEKTSEKSFRRTREPVGGTFPTGRYRKKL